MKRWCDHQLDTSVCESLLPLRRQFVIRDNRCDIAQLARSRKAGVTKLGAVGDDDRLIGAPQHLLLRSDKKHIAVVVTSFIRSGDTNHRVADIQTF